MVHIQSREIKSQGTSIFSKLSQSIVKFFLTFFMFFFFFATFIFTGHSSISGVKAAGGISTLNSGLISYWKMDEASGNALDIHSGKTFTAYNTPGTNTGKVYATARTFASASNQYFKRDSETALAGGADFTFATWFYLNSRVGQSPNYYMLMSSAFGTGGWSVGLVDNGNPTVSALQGFMQAAYEGGVYTAHVSWASAPVADRLNTWYLIIAWYDHATNTLWLSHDNGAEVNTVGPAPMVPLLVWPGFTYHYLGREQNGENLDGRMQSTMFWNRILTADERSTVWNNGNGVTYNEIMGIPPTLTSITIADTSGYTSSTTPTISIVSSNSPAYVAFSCNSGTNWSSWIAYADSISSFNITNGSTGCDSINGSKIITAKLKDSLGNESTTVNDTTYFDNTPPAFSSKSTYTGWYNSNQLSTFIYSDTGSGISSGTPVTCNVTTEGSNQTCSVTPNVCDTAGNCNIILVTSNGVSIDKTTPSSGLITYTNGYSTTAILLTLSDGIDSISGINTSTRIVQRESTTLTNGSCGSYGSFGTITPTGSYPSLTDGTIATGNCYQYQYLVSDNAGNQTIYTSLNIVKIDTQAPSIPGIPTTDSPTTNTKPTLTWTASADLSSGLANPAYTVKWSKDSTFNTEVSSSTTNTNSYTIQIELSIGTWYFKVNAVDILGNTSAYSLNGTLVVNSLPSRSSSLSSTGSSNSHSIQTLDKTITIKVVDSNGNNVVGAKVVLDSGPIVYTDSNGVATFGSVLGIEHSVVISYGSITYTKDLSLLDVNKDQLNNNVYSFELTENNSSLQSSSSSKSTSTLTSNTTSKSTATNTDSPISRVILVMLGLISLGGITTFFFFRQRRINKIA